MPVTDATALTVIKTSVMVLLVKDHDMTFDESYDAVKGYENDYWLSRSDLTVLAKEVAEYED